MYRGAREAEAHSWAQHAKDKRPSVPNHVLDKLAAGVEAVIAAKPETWAEVNRLTHARNLKDLENANN